jgi:hypothetical protein
MYIYLTELSNAVTKKGIRPDIAEGCPASLKVTISVLLFLDLGRYSKMLESFAKF